MKSDETQQKKRTTQPESERSEAIRRDEPAPIYAQIVNYFEDGIYAGRLQPGTRIPATLELAAQFGVGRNAVQQALSLLARRGLIERRTRLGSFVSRSLKAQGIAMVFGTNLVVRPELYFFRMLYDEVVKQTAAVNRVTSLFYPVEPGSTLYLTDLERKCAAGEIDGIIAYSSDPHFSHWQQRQNRVPCIFGSFDSIKPELTDGDAWRGADYLLRRGYRRLGVIGHTGSQKKIDRFIRSCVRDAFLRHNLPPDAHFALGEMETETDGIAAAAELLSCRPDALLVLNDTACRGVIFHLMQQGIAVPGQIGLFSLTNRGLPLLSPTPLTVLEHDAARHAQRVLEQLFARQEGRTPAEISILPQLRPGRSCGEAG